MSEASQPLSLPTPQEVSDRIEVLKAEIAVLRKLLKLLTENQTKEEPSHA